MKFFFIFLIAINKFFCVQEFINDRSMTIIINNTNSNQNSNNNEMKQSQNQIKQEDFKECG